MAGKIEPYRGAEFYKCDLQVQTPEDARHWDDDVRLKERTEPHLQEIARQFLRRCHEVDLDVIGVTDHNFSNLDNPREWFLTHLREQNKTVAEEVGRRPLVIFPGFELDIGFHVLCLFDPTTDLVAVHHCLTSLGLKPGERFDNGAPRDCRAMDGGYLSLRRLLKVIQDDHNGVVIAAHASSKDGILEARFKEDYREDALHAIEVNEFPLKAGVEQILRCQQPQWRRKRPTAFVMSSDCKRLKPKGADDTNYLGFRYTWIKMSRPSVAALRQAFLDQAHQIERSEERTSRIRFGKERPATSHAKITRVKVENAEFLADVDLAFSAHLNALIGGRGTGKSTLIEYLRVALYQEHCATDEGVRANIQRLKGTLTPTTHIEVHIEKDNAKWVLRSTGGKPAEVIEGTPIPDFPTLFPTRVYSQREIYAISDDREARARLIDNLITDKLAEATRKSEDAAQKIRAMNLELNQEPALHLRKAQLATEKLDYENRLARLAGLQTQLKTWQELLAEEQFLLTLGAPQLTTLRNLRSSIEKFNVVAKPSEALLLGPNGVTIQHAHDLLSGALDGVQTATLVAIDAALAQITNLPQDVQIQAWKTRFEEAKTDYQGVRAQLLTDGINPDEFISYGVDLRKRIEQLQEVETTLTKLSGARNARSAELAALDANWSAETQLRRDASAALMAAVPETDASTPFVSVDVQPFGDDEALQAHLDDNVRDGNKFNTTDVEALTEALVKHTPAGTPPTRLLAEWAEALARNENPPGCPWGHNDKKAVALVKILNPQRMGDLCVWRVPDRIRITLYRNDGTSAGELEDGLSVGQRCTAVLAVLLAQDTAPALIDQPEDDLDNEFIFNELVPLIRRVKHERQIIIATHNANIPVNGDAELVVALEYKAGRGTIKSVSGELALGALDAHSVKKSVEEIMEGGAEAFRRRHDKYGY